MKKLILFALLITPVLLMAQSKTEAEINTFIDQWHLDAANVDRELLSFSAGTLRGSGILVKRKDGWKIMHYVLSLPVPNDRFKAVMDAMGGE